MSLFNLVKQHYGIGLSAHLFGKLTRLVIADISGRRADNSGDRVLLHKFRHIKADKGLWRIKKLFRQHLYKGGFADARRSYKYKGGGAAEIACMHP